jgi:hypothetical protein
MSGERGICGDRPPGLILPPHHDVDGELIRGKALPGPVCELPHDHPGWHRSADDAHWSRTDDAPSLDVLIDDLMRAEAERTYWREKYERLEAHHRKIVEQLGRTEEER